MRRLISGTVGASADLGDAGVSVTWQHRGVRSLPPETGSGGGDRRADHVRRNPRGPLQVPPPNGTRLPGTNVHQACSRPPPTLGHHALPRVPASRRHLPGLTGHLRSGSTTTDPRPGLSRSGRPRRRSTVGEHSSPARRVPSCRFPTPSTLPSHRSTRHVSDPPSVLPTVGGSPPLLPHRSPSLDIHWTDRVPSGKFRIHRGNDQNTAHDTDPTGNSCTVDVQHVSR